MERRLDQEMVARGLVGSRSRARDAIRRGLVRVEGGVCHKPALLVRPEQVVTMADEAGRYVSRSGEKLAASLDRFGFDARGRIALDVGASTGGFTQVLLERGARRVYAVDVGHGQLQDAIAGDPRVVALERLDARALDRAVIPEPIEAIVADVSFISLTKALPAALALAARGAWLIALIKPQFEVGRDSVGKGGVVRDAAERERARRDVAQWLSAQAGWRVAGVTPSPIEGGSGNQEFLIGAEHNG